MTARYATIVSIIYIAIYLTGCEQSTVFSIDDDSGRQEVLPERGEAPLPVVDLQTADSPVRQQSGQSGAFSARSKIDWKPFKGLLKQVQRKHETEYVAMFSVREDEGGLYTYHTSKLTFSDSAMEQAGGRGRPFLYEVESPEGTLPRLAVAWIPDSDRAVNEMNLWMQPTRYRLPEEKQTDSDVALPSMGSSCSEIIETVYICSYNGDFRHSCEEVIVITESCGGGGGGTDPDGPFGDDDPYDDPWNWPDPDCDGPEGCGGGSGSGGGGGTSDCDPNAILPPVGCEETDDLEIILDPTFLTNQCLSSVYNQAGQAPEYQNILQNFDGEFSVAHLRLTGNSSMPVLTNAITHQPEDWVIKIEFNTSSQNLGERTDLDVARTLIHELIHAEMYRKLLSVAQLPDIPWSPTFLHSIRNDFPGLYDYYMRWHFNKPDGISPASPQHQLMAEHYRDTIEGALREFDNTQGDEVYEALAWAGLHNTVAWNNLDNVEQNTLREIRDLFNLNHPACQ